MRKPWNDGLHGLHLELGEQVSGLCKISGTSFKHLLKLLVKRTHMRGRHGGK
jgi:hypothetical protein